MELFFLRCMLIDCTGMNIQKHSTQLHVHVIGMKRHLHSTGEFCVFAVFLFYCY